MSQSNWKNFKTIKCVLFFLFLLTFSVSNAQISALTENGRQVTLFANGTWKYNSDSTAGKKNAPESIKLNPAKFSRSADATFPVKSNVVNIGIFINPNKWTFSTHRDNETNPEYRFSLKQGEGMAMIETERTPFTLENMRDIALTNAQKASIDAKILSQEYRVVNGNRILFLEMSGTIQGVKFRYMGYYFSNEKGTTQLLSFTTEAFYKETSKELETFLNGLVVIN
jgi:hypothetical protein